MPSRTFRAAACFHVVTELGGLNKMSLFPPVKLSLTPSLPVVHQNIEVEVVGIRLLAIVVVEDVSSLVAIVA